MDAKPLTLVLTGSTAAIWCAYALLSPKAADAPLLGILPMSTWDIFLHEPKYQLLLPIAAYLCLPVLAWFTKSKKLAWCIPAAPLLGIALFYLQFGVAMGAAFT